MHTKAEVLLSTESCNSQGQKAQEEVALGAKTCFVGRVLLYKSFYNLYKGLKE